ncbi:hypothetical protein E2F50_12300 [Rhizobium deserti]|uniref:Uncharacterized protein n=1 Tax=Rhizobium deserti TaxID=2547961 RepID=A0A4R5UGW3_9HYPH|nr:hypothetical protein [Rhizobium deserti]TDK35046.1 hypothetical protein E2F50_12300 [Rhizobium deserti]
MYGRFGIIHLPDHTQRADAPRWQRAAIASRLASPEAGIFLRLFGVILLLFCVAGAVALRLS